MKTVSPGTAKPPAAPPKGFVRPRFQKKQETGYPKLRDLFAIPSVALTVVIMAYSGLFGIYPILLLYALWLPRAYYKGRLILKPSRDVWVPIGFGFYCLLSGIWSYYPETSLHNALEYISMILCTIVASRIVTIEVFVKGVVAGTMLVLLAAFTSGHYDASGLFGSKNQVGLYAEIGFFAAILCFFIKISRVQKLIFAAFPVIFFSLCLVLSQSGASVVTLVLVLGICYTATFVARFSQNRRAPVLFTAIFFAAAVAAAGIYLGEQKALLQMMGKDATLTGRTYLWSEGIKVGLHDPILGHGYNAFWIPGQPEAEKYWFEFGIYVRSGFHFHSLLVQTFVDLGAIGLLIMMYMILTNCIKSFRYVIRNGAGLNAIFCLGISFLFFARAFVEVDFLGPFGIGVFLFFSMPPRLAAVDTADMQITKPRRDSRPQFMPPPAPGLV